MADLVVIFDPEREIGAIVNLDTASALGPCMIGENAAVLLQGFVDQTPFDLSVLAPFDCVQAFGGFLDRLGDRLTVAADTPTESAVESPPPDDLVTEHALAEAEATNGTGTPPAAPADTDVESDPRTETVTRRCFNCEGTGMIEFGDGSASQRCGMCGGTGKIEEQVTL